MGKVRHCPPACAGFLLGGTSDRVLCVGKTMTLNQAISSSHLRLRQYALCLKLEISTIECQREVLLHVEHTIANPLPLILND
jgi:hypothetical protein